MINTQTNTRTITSYKNTNWKEFRKTLENEIKTNNRINTIEELNKELEIYTNALKNAQT